MIVTPPLGACFTSLSRGRTAGDARFNSTNDQPSYPPPSARLPRIRNRPLLGVPCGRMMVLSRWRVAFKSSAIVFLLLQHFRALSGTPHLATIGVEAHADGHVLGSVEERHNHGNSTGLFSREWEAMYGSGHVGCDLGRKRYYWRPCGLGSNIIREWLKRCCCCRQFWAQD